VGVYRVNSYKKLIQERLPDDYCHEDDYSDCVFWNLEKTDILADLTERLIIDWGKGTKNWCQNGTTEKEVVQILPRISPLTFKSYEEVLLKYSELRHIIATPQEHAVWVSKLSTVAGVYAITDTKTGKLYIGSASGEKSGIWGRWSEYANTKDGGNKRLIELINADKDYCDYFQFSLLEVFPIKRDRQAVLECEALYKKKFCTIEHGLNAN
jgi:hypothetical protein